jgi:hypothetical protein
MTFPAQEKKKIIKPEYTKSKGKKCTMANKYRITYTSPSAFHVVKREDELRDG